MDNPFFFIVACPRSGTTLLQRMLDHHPLLAVVNEARFIPLAIREAPTGVDARFVPTEPVEGAGPALTPEMVGRARSYKRFSRLGLSDDEVDQAASASASYAEFVGNLFSVFARSKGKQLSGDKAPFYALHMPFLHSLFPRAKFVHLIRDARDVALSVADWASKRAKGPRRFELWSEEPIAATAFWWKWYVETAQSSGRDIGADAYQEIRYETLAAEPENSLRKVCDFLEVPFDPTMLDFHKGRTRRRIWGRRLTSKRAWLPPTPSLRDWRTHMSDRDVQLIEAITGERLQELGYELSGNGLPDDVRDLAGRCEQRWEAEMERTRLGRGPGARR
jgi:hypothetical protein